MSAAAVDPSSRSEILAALAEGESRIVNFFGELAPELFYRSPAGKWSPDGHLRHLTMVLERVGTRFAAVPSAEAKTLPGRSYLQLRDDYRAALEAGGKAPAAFLPAPASAPTTEAQASALYAFQTASDRLAEHLNQPIWTETALDSAPFAHPLLNQISARELLFFTVYHNLHHLEGARNSMEQA